MLTRSSLAFGSCLLAAALTSVPSFADDTDVPSITIHAVKGSLTVPSVVEQKDELDQTAGSVGFVDAKDYQQTYANTLRDVLQDQPGVFVENRYGQELRLSIRGSGIARSYHTRGLEILQDGIPTNLADGSGDYYEIDPLALRSAEIFKGGNGLAYGSSTLGGAINFVTPTAYTAIAPDIVRLEGGSFGTIRSSAQVSRIEGDADFLMNGTVTHADGYREHERTQSEDLNANMGYRLAPNAETRFYLGSFTVDQQLPGTLSLNDALTHPTLANPTAISGDQARDERIQRIANRTTIDLDAGKLDLDTWAIHKTLFHPIFQTLDQDGWTYGIAPRFTTTFDVLNNRNDVIVGTRIFAGNNQALQFTNVSGSRGTQTLNSEQDAYNFEAYAENRYWFVPQVALMTGAKLFDDQRIYKDYGGLAADPIAKNDEKDYAGVNPKLGFLWQPDPDIQAFIDGTRSQDVPDFTDLTQTTATTTQFTPLQAQDAWTLELGSRGRQGIFGWDATAYRSWVQHELLQFTTDPNIPASTFNANNTLHQGLELGGSVDIIHNLLHPEEGDMVTLKQLWNVSDFRFQGDPQYGNNHIAGVPENVLRSEIAYKHPDGFYLTPSIDWVPNGAWADQANTLRAPGYVLLGLQTGIQFDNGILVYVDARNLTNEHYISDISTITDARTTSTAIFYPGEGRSVYTGVRYAF